MFAITDQKLRFALGIAIVWFFTALWAMSVFSGWGTVGHSTATGSVCPVIHLGFGGTTGMAAHSDAALIYYLTPGSCASYYVMTLPITLLVFTGVFLLARFLFRKTGLIK